MTEMMMEPDAGLADRLGNVRYDVAPQLLRNVANYDGRERMRLRAVAAGAENMTVAAVKEMLVKWRDTIAPVVEQFIRAHDTADKTPLPSRIVVPTHIEPDVVPGVELA